MGQVGLCRGGAGRASWFVQSASCRFELLRSAQQKRSKSGLTIAIRGSKTLASRIFKSCRLAPKRLQGCATGRNRAQRSPGGGGGERAHSARPHAPQQQLRVGAHKPHPFDRHRGGAQAGGGGEANALARASVARPLDGAVRAHTHTHTTISRQMRLAFIAMPAAARKNAAAGQPRIGRRPERAKRRRGGP